MDTLGHAPKRVFVRTTQTWHWEKASSTDLVALPPWNLDHEHTPHAPANVASTNAQSLAYLHYQQMHEYLQERGPMDDNRDEDQNGFGHRRPAQAGTKRFVRYGSMLR
jgi:hypothetical protein